MTAKRVVIVTSGRHGVASDCLQELTGSTAVTVIGVIVAGPSPWTWRLIRRKFRKAMTIGIGGALNGLRMRDWYRSFASRDLKDICAERGVPFFEVPQVNSADTVEVLSKLAPDLGLSLGNSYIARRVFSIPGQGMINVHGERLPEYQNAQSVIWPVFHGETKTGLSIHRIDDGIDTGAILYKEEFEILFGPGLEQTVRRTASLINAKVPTAVRFVCENFDRLAAQQQPQVRGTVFTTPSFAQFGRMTRNNRELYLQQERVRRSNLVRT